MTFEDWFSNFINEDMKDYASFDMYFEDHSLRSLLDQAYSFGYDAGYDHGKEDEAENNAIREAGEDW